MVEAVQHSEFTFGQTQGAGDHIQAEVAGVARTGDNQDAGGLCAASTPARPAPRSPRGRELVGRSVLYARADAAETPLEAASA